MERQEAAKGLSEWFARNGRSLPWRSKHEPYHVLIAEFILQQTRMDVGIPRFHSFLARFPTIERLAQAEENEVLIEWSGLGYYARARNLHRAARAIVRDHGGEIPSDPAVLRELPGIGAYTAGAVASIAFDRPEPSLDGNQFRVYGRYLGIDPSSAGGRRGIESWARTFLESGSPRILNQAVMDLGGAVCTPRNPKCADCPLFTGCSTRGEGKLPNTKGKAVPVEAWVAARHRRGDEVWLSKPRGTGLLGTHWMPPLRQGKGRGAPDLEHTFSHRRWKIWWADAETVPSGDGRWVRLEDLDALPHGPITRRFVESALRANVADSSRSQRVPSERRAAPSTKRA